MFSRVKKPILSDENLAKYAITNENDLTEIALDDYKNWNMVVENDSTYEDLIQKADEICELYQKFIGL